MPDPRLRSHPRLRGYDRRAVLEHSFNGTPFTLGIEEELMICDADSLELAQGIERILGAIPDDVTGYVKPELHQSVLEVATLPCRDVAEADGQLRDLRRTVRGVAEGMGMVIGAAPHIRLRCTRTRRSSSGRATWS